MDDYSSLITVTECAKLCNVSRQTIYDWLERGDAPRNVVIGGTTYFYRDNALLFRRESKSSA